MATGECGDWGPLKKRDGGPAAREFDRRTWISEKKKKKARGCEETTGIFLRECADVIVILGKAKKKNAGSTLEQALWVMYAGLELSGRAHEAPTWLPWKL